MEPPRRYTSSAEITREYELKYVPATTNLAKVYYLENREEFIKHNSEYIRKVLDKIQATNKNNEKQKNWDKYM